MMQLLRNVWSKLPSKAVVQGLSKTLLLAKEKGTIHPEEVAKFSEVAQDWWGPKREWQMLREMNRLRVPFVRNGILQTRLVSNEQIDSSLPLKNVKILDVGCGGGLLAEPLARLGANVTGIDPVQENIYAAENHARIGGLLGNLDYVCSTVEDHAAKFHEHYDAVVSSEVAEHVADLDLFIKSIISLTKDTGSVFITTINKTFLSWLLVKQVAEYVLRIVPAETHDWEKFISPNHLEHLFKSGGCDVRAVQGMRLLPFIYKWEWSSNTDMNYALHAVKRNEK